MLKAQILSAQDALKQTQGQVLLINPPVIDSRYEWVRWNQPLDLLKLGTALKQEHDCQVKLFDFMLPTPAGTVPRRQSRIEVDLPPGEPIRWQFGESWETFDAHLDMLVSRNWIPDYVWITTLTSFWWQTVPLVADRVKNKLKHPAVVLCGSYPIVRAQHAAQFCSNVDIVVEDRLPVAQLPADFSLYEEGKLRFCALDLRGSEILNEIINAARRGISHFVFFNDNLFKEFNSHLGSVLQEVVKLKDAGTVKVAGNKDLDIQFHGICGVGTKDFPVDQAQLLAKAHFSELHFEPALKEDGTVDESQYREVMQACEEAGFVHRRGLGWESRSYYLSGFLWIGRPDDDLDKLVWNALKLIQLVGMVIPKPYSPTPGTDDYKLLESRVDYIEPEDISPHRLPFAGHNGLEKNDYEDLYRLTALLNRKVRSQTFDFLGNTYLAKVIRESLAGRRWDIPLKRSPQ